MSHMSIFSPEYLSLSMKSLKFHSSVLFFSTKHTDSKQKTPHFSNYQGRNYILSIWYDFSSFFYATLTPWQYATRQRWMSRRIRPRGRNSISQSRARGGTSVRFFVDSLRHESLCLRFLQERKIDDKQMREDNLNQNDRKVVLKAIGEAGFRSGKTFFWI